MIALLLAAVISVGVQGPTRAPDREAHITAMRALARAHIDTEAQRFTPAELADIEARYRMAHAHGLPMLTGPEAVAILEALIERYPLSNRAGCAALEVARAASADTRERLLEEVIATHGDAWFENGVQVGAAARASLATHLAGLDRYDEAERIAVEMVQRFPGAIDETGAVLDDLPRSINLLRVPKREPARLTSAIGRRLRTVLCCAVLQMGTLVGVPMRPEQIRDLMQSLNQPKLAQTNPEEDPSGGRRV